MSDREDAELRLVEISTTIGRVHPGLKLDIDRQLLTERETAIEMALQLGYSEIRGEFLGGLTSEDAEKCRAIIFLRMIPTAFFPSSTLGQTVNIENGHSALKSLRNYWKNTRGTIRSHLDNQLKQWTRDIFQLYEAERAQAQKTEEERKRHDRRSRLKRLGNTVRQNVRRDRKSEGRTAADRFSAGNVAQQAARERYFLCTRPTDIYNPRGGFPESYAELDFQKTERTSPFTEADIGFVQAGLRDLVTGQDAANFVVRLQQGDDRIKKTLVYVEEAHAAYRKVLEEQRDADIKKYKMVAGVVGAVLGVGLTAVAGPLGPLLGHVLVGAAAKIGQAQVTDLVDQLLAKGPELKKPAIKAAVKFIEPKVQERLVEKYSDASRALDTTSAADSTTGDLRDERKVRGSSELGRLKEEVISRLSEFRETVMEALNQGIWGITGSPAPGSFSTPGPDLLRKKAIELLWHVHEQKIRDLHADEEIRLLERQKPYLGHQLDQHYVGPDLKQQTLNYLEELKRAIFDHILSAFALKEHGRVLVEPTNQTERSTYERVIRDIKTFFELQFWWGWFAKAYENKIDEKIGLPDGIKEELINLGFVAQMSRSATAKERAYMKGQVRYGNNTVNEANRLRGMLYVISKIGNPTGIILTGESLDDMDKRLKAMDTSIREMGRFIEDWLSGEKDAGRDPTWSGLKAAIDARLQGKSHPAAVSTAAAATGSPSASGSKDPEFAWQDDSEVDACPGCGTSFGVFTRKHHCRKCGKIYCSACCPKRKYTGGGNFFKRSGEVRICKDCQNP